MQGGEGEGGREGGRERKGEEGRGRKREIPSLKAVRIL